MIQTEPFPEDLLPPKWRGIYKGEIARHMYRYHDVSRGPAKEIIREFETRLKAGTIGR